MNKQFTEVKTTFLDELGGEILKSAVVAGPRWALEPRLPEPQVGGGVVVADGAVVVAVSDAAAHVGHVGRPERVGGGGARRPLACGLETGQPDCQFDKYPRRK